MDSRQARQAEEHTQWPIISAAQKGKEGVEFVLGEMGVRRDSDVSHDPAQIQHRVRHLPLQSTDMVSLYSLSSQVWFMVKHEALDVKFDTLSQTTSYSIGQGISKACWMLIHIYV